MSRGMIWSLEQVGGLRAEGGKGLKLTGNRGFAFAQRGIDTLQKGGENIRTGWRRDGL
jgi:hypothetical protein